MSAAVAAAAVDALGAAFLSGDPDAVLRQFTTAADPIYAGSEPEEVALGRAAVRALLETLFRRDERYSWRTTRVAATGEGGVLHLVADAELLVHPCVNGAPGAATERVAYRIAGVLEREPEGWHWRLCQGSEPSMPR